MTRTSAIFLGTGNFLTPNGRYWNSFLLRPYRETDIQNVRTKEAVAGYTRNWGAETPPSAFILSANYEEESVSGGPFCMRWARLCPRRNSMAMYGVPPSSANS